MSLLAISHLAAYYGASQVLFDINLQVNEGAVTALMGRNGMGKTTTIKAITRMLRTTTGELMFDGQEIGALPSHVVARRGVGLVPEGRRCFTNLSVDENLQAAARAGHWDFHRVCQLFPRLEERRHQSASTLSGGEQQMLAIARALMTNPRLLILDEATEGLAPLVRQEIWAAIATLKSETGLGILVVDKSLKELATVADEACVVQRGSTVWSGAFDQLTAEITDQYLGV